MTTRATTLAALLLGALATPALAGPVPAGTNEEFVSAGAGDATHPFLTGSNHQFVAGNYGTTESSGSATSVATLNAPDMSIPVLDGLVSTTVGAGAALNSGANATIQGFTNYSFQVAGTGDTLLHLAASGGVGFSAFESGGSGSADLTFRVREANNGPIIYDQSFFMDASHAGCIDLSNPSVYGPCSLAFAVDNDFLIHTNTIYDVHMDVTAHLTAGGGVLGGTDTAFANIDPTFAVQAPFTIQLSDGFGGGINAPAPGSSAPEPQTWTMMLVGFAGLGAAVRTRRRRALA